MPFVAAACFLDATDLSFLDVDDFLVVLVDDDALVSCFLDVDFFDAGFFDVDFFDGGFFRSDADFVIVACLSFNSSTLVDDGRCGPNNPSLTL